jgi:preprotein translocase subunit SecG
MQMILTVLQLLLSLGLIGLVLIQHGRGADAGAAFGSGASATVFGAQGSGSFLSRATAILATLFFLTSMALAYYAAQSGKTEDLMDGVVAEEPMAPPEVPESELPPVPVPVPVSPRSDVPAVPVAPAEAPVPAESSVPAVPDAGQAPSEAPDPNAAAGESQEGAAQGQ